MALFLFRLAQKVLASLPTAYFVALMPLFPIRHVRCVQVFQLKTMPFCKLSTGLGSTNKFLFLSNSRSVLATFSSSPPFLLSHSFRDISRNYLPFFAPPYLSRYSWLSATHFLSLMPLPKSWLDEVHCFSHLKSHIVSFLFPLISTVLFSRTRKVLSHVNSSTHRSSQHPPRNFSSVITLVVSSLVFAAPDTTFC